MRPLCARSAVGLVLMLASAVAAQNQPPAQPQVTEPQFDGRIVNASDVHMECTNFSDPNPGDQHLCTDWEIWSIDPPERVWVTECIGGVERLHTHLGDGIFENSHEGRRALLYDKDYRLRVRHRDNSGAFNSYGPFGERPFRTAPATQVSPLELADVASTPPAQLLIDKSPYIFGAGSPAAFARLETSDGELLVEVRSLDGMTNEVVNAPAQLSHHPVRLRLNAGGLVAGLVLPETEFRFTSDDGQTRNVYLPSVALPPGGEVSYWISSSGASYLGSAGQTTPDFSVLARGAPSAWRLAPGYRLEQVAGGLTLPVNMAFVPDPSPEKDAPFFYVTELYGTVKVVYRDGSVHDYATGLINFPPSGNFPGSGEQGLTGIAVDPQNGDVYVTHLYEAAGGFHFPAVVRLTSSDGGRTSNNRITILDMFGELQGQSHQISNISFGPDNLLYVHMGDGFQFETALDLDSYRGKILRLRRDGTPALNNPFYDAADGISARDYVFAYGFRNPFGGAWRVSDGRLYEVENGPSVDRLALVERGASYGYNGTDESMQLAALFNWIPVTAPVDIAFIEPGVFGGSGFPQSKWGSAFVTLSGPTWLEGTTPVAKRIVEFGIGANGEGFDELGSIATYIGAGRHTACAIAAGPDGLYFSTLYEDTGLDGPIAPGAEILRIKYAGTVDFNADVQRGPGPLPVKFRSVTTVPGAARYDWDFGDGAFSNDPNPVHVYANPGLYTVRLSVTGKDSTVFFQRNDYITVTSDLRAAFVGGADVPNESDGAAVAALQAAGFTVDYYRDSDPARPRGAALGVDRNLLMVSSTISDITALAEFRLVDTPLIFWEQSMLPGFAEGLSATAQIAAGQAAVHVADAGHPITYGLPLGSNTVYAPADRMNIALPSFAPGLHVVAERDKVPGSAAIGVVETGDPLLADRAAAARRVFFFLDENTFPSLTPVGRELFDRAVCWATGLGAEFVLSPADTNARSSQTVTLRSIARGADVQYQWRRNGLPIPDATAADLVISPVGSDDAGDYDVVATGACGSHISRPATLRVLCGGDFNADNQVNSQDLFDFIECFFGVGCPRADFNGDALVNTQDFFDFIGEFFTPCG